MGGRGRVARGATIAGIVAVAMPLSVGAQGWISLPSGELAYQTSYLTSGVFRCGHYVVAGGCQSLGNTIVLRNGSSTMTISFAGVSASISASNANRAPVQLGTFTRTVTGGGTFTPPYIRAKNGMFFGFTLHMAMLAPLPQHRQLPIQYIRRSGGFQAASLVGADYLNYRVVPPPAPWTYRGLSIADIGFQDIPFTEGSADMVAQSASITPEPATLLLVASGLLGVGGVMRRSRRRRSR